MKNGCTLCGGKVVGGVCRECGWDNRKNDAHYRLNRHNENGVKMHTSDCEDHLNKNCDASKQNNNRTPVTRERKAQIKNRHQTGTAKKKKSLFGTVAVWIIIIGILEFVVSFLSEIG